MALDKNDLELLLQIERKLDTVIESLNATNERIDHLTNRIDALDKSVLENTWCVVKNSPQAQ